MGFAAVAALGVRWRRDRIRSEPSSDRASDLRRRAPRSACSVRRLRVERQPGRRPRLRQPRVACSTPRRTSGRIMRVSRGKKTVLLATLDVAGGGEAGLLGLAGDERGQRLRLLHNLAQRLPESDQQLERRRHQRPLRLALQAVRRQAQGRQSDLLVRSPERGVEPRRRRTALRSRRRALPRARRPRRERRPGQGTGSRAEPLGALRQDPAPRPVGDQQGAAGNPTTCGNADNSAQRNDRATTASTPAACATRTASTGTAQAPLGGRRRRQLRRDQHRHAPASTTAGSRRAPTAPAPATGARSSRSPARRPASRSRSPSRPARWRNDVFYGIFAESSLMRYDIKSRKRARSRPRRGRTGWDLIANDRYIYMSNGNAASRAWRCRAPAASSDGPARQNDQSTSADCASCCCRSRTFASSTTGGASRWSGR